MNMGNFRSNSRGGFRGQSSGNRFGGNRGGGFNRDRGGFGGGRGSERRSLEMHDATCAKCGKNCQVPFRPTGRPVYCSDCFKQNEGSGNNFGSRNQNSASQSGASLQQFNQINAKLDKILQVLQNLEIDTEDDSEEDLDDEEDLEEDSEDEVEEDLEEDLDEDSDEDSKDKADEDSEEKF